MRLQSTNIHPPNACMKHHPAFPILCAALAGLPLQAANLTGLWTFDNVGSLGQATVGTNLAFLGAAPGTWSATLQDDHSKSLSGVITTPAAAFGNQIIATHGIAPNGGGAYVNEYSIVLDLFSPAGSRSSWRTIYQTNTGNSNDGEYFIDPATDVLGVAQMTYSGSPIDETSWTRLVVTFNLENGGASDIRTYLNGSLFYVHSSGGNELDGRFSLDPTVLFVSDNDGDNAPLHVGAIAIYDGALTAGEVAALGVAGAPIAVPEPTAAALALIGLATGARVRRRRR